MHSQIAYFAPRDPGYVIDVSGAGVLASSHHQAAADEFLAFLVSAAGPGDHGQQRQLRVPPCDRVWPPRPGCGPSISSSPRR